MIDFFNDAKESDLLEDEMAYEALVAYTFLERGDDSATEALLRCLPIEKSLSYLASFQDSFKSLTRLFIQIEIKKFLDDQDTTIDSETRLRLVELSKGYVLRGEFIQVNEIMKLD